MPSKTILIVDDNDDNRFIYVTLLEHVGYRILQASGGQEAIDVARAELPDLILMDLQMPGVNGFQAAQELKADSRTADIQIIAITALAMDDDRALAMAAGCDDYFTKPMEPHVLRVEVERLIGPPVEDDSGV